MSEPSESPGQPGYGAGEPGYGPPARRNGMGTAALVLGILGLVLFLLPPVALLLGIAAVVLGILGRRRSKRQEATNGGVALAGIITGALAVVLAGVLITIAVLVSQSDEFDNLSDCLESADGDDQEEEACADEFREQLDP